MDPTFSSQQRFTVRAKLQFATSRDWRSLTIVSNYLNEARLHLRAATDGTRSWKTEQAPLHDDVLLYQSTISFVSVTTMNYDSMLVRVWG